MRWSLRRFTLTKQVPLTISRTTAAVEHLLLELEHGGQIGRGETGGFDTARGSASPSLSRNSRAVAAVGGGWLAGASPLASAAGSAECAGPLADGVARSRPAVGQPLWRLWGLRGCQPTSVTLGLAPVRRCWARTLAPAAASDAGEVEAGQPHGLSHDRPWWRHCSCSMGRNCRWMPMALDGGARQMLPW